LNCASVWLSVSTSRSAREKLAMRVDRVLEIAAGSGRQGSQDRGVAGVGGEHDDGDGGMQLGELQNYYTEGTCAALLVAGAVAGERWIARGHRTRGRRGIVLAAPLLSKAISLPTVLPVVPVADLHEVPNADTVTTKDTVGWPQLTRAAARQDRT
jgi:hypothetical protein